VRAEVRKDAPKPPSPIRECKGTGGGGDMTAAGPFQVGGREQGSKRGVRDTAPPRPPASGPSFAAVVASAGEPRSPPCAVIAGGASGGGVGKVGATADGGVLRVSPSSSPPPPRPEPKRKKGGPPPLKAAACKAKPPSPVQAATSGANNYQGMRTLGSSIPAKDPRVGGRDVTVDKFISAVSLLVECAAGVLTLGYPARAAAAASPPSVPSPDVLDRRGACRPRHRV